MFLHVDKSLAYTHEDARRRVRGYLVRGFYNGYLIVLFFSDRVQTCSQFDVSKSLEVQIVTLPYSITLVV